MEIIVLGDGFLSIFKTNAVIIRTQDFKENDKLVYLFTEKLGKVKAVAKGAKSSKSKFLSSTLQLCFGEYVIFKGRNLYTLNEGKIINSFQGLLDDLNKLTYSTYLCELIDICLLEEESNRQLFKDFVTVLYLMNTNAIDNEMLVRAFELRVLKATGYGLDFDNCSICKKRLTSSNYISLAYYGGVCDQCQKVNGIYVSKGTFNALKFLKNTSLDKVYRLNLNKDIKEEIYKVMSTIISSNYGRKPKSLEMLNFLKECERNG